MAQRCRIGVLGARFEPLRRSSDALRAQFRQRAQSGQIVGGHGQREDLVDSIEPAHHDLADRAEVVPLNHEVVTIGIVEISEFFADANVVD